MKSVLWILGFVHLMALLQPAKLAKQPPKTTDENFGDFGLQGLRESLLTCRTERMDINCAIHRLIYVRISLVKPAESRGWLHHHRGTKCVKSIPSNWFEKATIHGLKKMGNWGHNPFFREVISPFFSGWKAAIFSSWWLKFRHLTKFMNVEVF